MSIQLNECQKKVCQCKIYLYLIYNITQYNIIIKDKYLIKYKVLGKTEEKIGFGTVELGLIHVVKKKTMKTLYI